VDNVTVVKCAQKILSHTLYKKNNFYFQIVVVEFPIFSFFALNLIPNPNPLILQLKLTHSLSPTLSHSPASPLSKNTRKNCAVCRRIIDCANYFCVKCGACVCFYCGAEMLKESKYLALSALDVVQTWRRRVQKRVDILDFIFPL
jgi:hypothetical protein